MTREQTESAQRAQLLRLLAAVQGSNPFYQEKLRVGCSPGVSASLAELLQSLPFTSKLEIAEDQRCNPPFGTNLTCPPDAYVRSHQTSGTSGRPIVWLDTPVSWNWMLDRWLEVYESTGVEKGSVIYFAFSFGPFLGFWTAFEAASRHLHARCLAGGGLSSSERLRQIIDHKADTLCCTPTYALHLSEKARQEGIDLSRSQVRRIIVAGEPGGSVPTTRARIESAWPGSRVWDHHGMTEIGPVTRPCPALRDVLHVMEQGFIAEILNPNTLRPCAENELGELILTNLGRTGSPLIRYRTGDLVEMPKLARCECGTWDLALRGGIRGRTDDMVVVRGVNLYPSGVEAVIRSVPRAGEYQVELADKSDMIEVRLRVEPSIEGASAGLAEAVAKAFQDAFLLRAEVRLVPFGSLPRYEHKARRWSRTRM
ncbi:MAG: phenylacetate--CoA ligase [Verrucomicrobia bacterium]|nr:phenylacetate--CoA ligase [Verrucomicrobiota bacterium]